MLFIMPFMLIVSHNSILMEISIDLNLAISARSPQYEPREEERLLPLKRKANSADLPQGGPTSWQAGDIAEAAIIENRIQQHGTMLHCFGTPQGRRPASAHRYILDRQIASSFCPTIRLRYR